MQLIDFFLKGVERYPDRAVVVDGDRRWTYAEMAKLVDQVASALIHAGLRPGAKVAIYSPNHALVLAAQYGALRAGCLWVPVSHRNSASSTHDALAALGVDWLFVHSSLAEAAIAARAAVPSLKGVIGIDRDIGALPGLIEWSQRAPFADNFPLLGSNSPAAILMSSGTTGKPKGIVLSQLAFTSMIASFDALLPVGEAPIHLVVAPLTHAAGIYAMALLAHGGTNWLQHAAEPGAIVKALADSRATTVFLPPTIIYMMLAHPDVRKHDYSSLRSLLYGAAPMSVQKLREAMALFGPVLAQGYGQSEALMCCTFLSAQDHAEALANPQLERRLRSAGREGPMVRVAIMDEAGKLLGAGEQGEIVVRGDIVMDHYHDNPEATAEAQLFGWHHTGDIGFKDADGFVYIVDRKKDMIISGGFNVFPAEVEQVLMAHQTVKDCAVVGVPDDKWGEAVLAVVELLPGAEFDEAALIAYTKQHLGSVKAPKKIQVMEALPRSAVGKVVRREIRDPFWRGRDRKV